MHHSVQVTVQTRKRRPQRKIPLKRTQMVKLSKHKDKYPVSITIVLDFEFFAQPLRFRDFWVEFHQRCTKLRVKVSQTEKKKVEN